MPEHQGRWRRAVWAVALIVPLALVAVAGVSIAAALVPASSAAPTPSSPRPAHDDGKKPHPPAAPAGQTHPSPSATPLPEPSSPAPAEPVPAPVDPLHPGCDGTTVMSVWAHYDDDLLFLGTPIADALASGQCVRTVFLTGGDAGKGAAYEDGRERGILRAYDVMRGAEGPWSSTAASLDTGAHLTVWTPDGDPRLSLVFFRLPDGNLTGEGFPGSGEVSLAKLAADKIADIPSLDGSYRLTWSGVVTSVQELITGFAPASFYTHVPGYAHRWAKGDHADHAITGVIARKAWLGAAVPGSTAQYAVGYQTADAPANVSGETLERKVAAFRAYAADDSVTAGCRDTRSCLELPRFGRWLQRQYLKSDAEIAGG